MNRLLQRFAALLIGLLAVSSLALAGNGALLGVTTSYPLINFTGGGVVQSAVYNGAALTITGTPVFVTFKPIYEAEFISGGGLTLTANIDSTGTLSGGTFTVSGMATDNATVITYGPPLLTGTVTDYGIVDIGEPGGTDVADFRLTATGGSLLELMGGDGAEISMIVTLAGSGFAGSFDSNWAADHATGDVGVAGPPPDTDPDPFSFTDQGNVAPLVSVTSGAVTITGINTPTLIAISGDDTSEYSIGCTEPYTTDVGFVTDSVFVCVRHTSASALSTAVNTTLTVGGSSETPTVGGVSDTFTSTTGAITPPPDTVPNNFNFVGQGNLPVSSLVESGPAFITGLTGPASIPVSVSGNGGSEYSIGCTGTYTNAAGQIGIPPDQVQADEVAVCVRHTTAATPASQFATFLNVGGVVGVFTTITTLPDPLVVNDAAPAPTPAEDPPLILFDKTNPATADTGQSIVVEEEGVRTGGEVGIGFCVADDPRETELNNGTYNPRSLPLSELAGRGTCGGSLANETLEIPAHIRAFPDAGGVPRFLIATVWTTADLDGMLLSQAFPEEFIDFPGGTSPVCNAPLSNRPLWLWGTRSGENTAGAVAGEDEVMQPTAIQCNASRSGTKRLSNFISTVRLDENLISSKSFLADQVRTVTKTLKALARDDDRCGVEQQNLTVQLQTQGTICRTATVYPRVSRVSKVAPRRITANLYEYTMKVTLTNPGKLVTAAKLKLTSGSPTTKVVGGPLTLNFGKIAAGVTTASQTFRIRQNPNLPVDPKVILAAVDFTPAASDPNRYTKARAACEALAELAKGGRAAFNSCPADIQAKKYRGALISGGLAAAFTIFDRLEKPLAGATWSIYPLPPEVVDPGQIP